MPAAGEHKPLRERLRAAEWPSRQTRQALLTALPGLILLATFNHPGPDQYNNWDYRDPAITDIITMLEVINSNNKIHYAAFVNALGLIVLSLWMLWEGIGGWSRPLR